jgi:hypothetical protein
MAEPKKRRRLDTLAYRCTPALLDGATVWIREFPAGVRSMWRILERDYGNRVGREEAQPPYSIATSALRCLAGGYAYFDPERLFLVTRDPIDDDLLRDTFTLFHKIANGEDPEDIDLTAPTALADRIAETPQQERLLADCITRTDGGQPSAPAWAYQSAAWDLSRRLAQGTWAVDGLQIPLMPDSEGGLIAWDNPWSSRNGTAHSLARIRLRMKTIPNIADPVILASATVTRVKSGMAYTRTVLAAQGDPSRPIVEIQMAGRNKIRTISRLSLQTLARLGMDHSVLRTVQDRINHERQAEQAALEAGADSWYPPGAELGPVRPLHSKNYKFPIGHGVGMHFLRELDARFCEVLGDTADSPPVYFDTQGFKRTDRKDGLYASPADVERSLKTMGYTHLRIACLWYTDEIRLRMIQGICAAYGLSPASADPAEGVPFPLCEGTVSAVFHEVPKFLAHGPNSGSVEAITDLPSLIRPDPGTLSGVWAETEYDTTDSETSEEEEGGDHATQAGRPAEDEDAKLRARRTLARLAIPSQFMKSRGTAKPPKAGQKDEDHPVILSQLDLNRSLGIIDSRIDEVMVDAIGLYPADGVAHCGIFVRRQSKRRGENTTKICITAAVLMPPPSRGQAWALHGWSYTSRQWQPYHQAQAAYHALDYQVGKLTEIHDDNQGYKKVARVIDEALGDLASYLGGTPYTVTVDGVATRRLWEGLHNNKQGQLGSPGTTWLPGHTLPLGDRPIAVIRVNRDDEEVLRPIRVSHVDLQDNVIGTNETTQVLYRLEPDFGEPAWYLVTVPPQYDGAGAGRLGDKKTRWTADYGSSIEGERRVNEMRHNWYAMNATEIYVISIRNDIDGRALARMTARLCHQPLAWTARTRYPVHLHAAQQMDLDHPQYRRSALGDDDAAGGNRL